MKDGSGPRLCEEQMDFHVRSGFTRPTERNLSESKTREVFLRNTDKKIFL